MISDMACHILVLAASHAHEDIEVKIFLNTDRPFLVREIRWIQFPGISLAELEQAIQKLLNIRWMIVHEDVHVLGCADKSVQGYRQSPDKRESNLIIDEDAQQSFECVHHRRSL